MDLVSNDELAELIERKTGTEELLQVSKALVGVVKSLVANRVRVPCYILDLADIARAAIDRAEGKS